MKKLCISLCLFLLLLSVMVSAINFYVPVTVTVNPRFSISLDQHWNLISIPLVLSDPDIETVLAPIMDKVIVVNSFEAGPGPGSGAKTYDPKLPGFSDLKEMDHLHGYWIKLTEPAELSVSGAVPEDRTISLKKKPSGWNLISYLCNESKSVEDVFSGIMDNVIVIRGFERGGKSYYPDLPPVFNTLHEMKPGFGYWVKVKKDVDLEYNNICQGGV